MGGGGEAVRGEAAEGLGRWGYVDAYVVSLWGRGWAGWVGLSAEGLTRCG